MKTVSHLDSGYPRYCGQISVTSVGGNDGGTEHLFEVEGGGGRLGLRGGLWRSGRSGRSGCTRRRRMRCMCWRLGLWWGGREGAGSTGRLRGRLQRRSRC